MPAPADIRRYHDVSGRPGLHAAIDTIFFQSSNTQDFDSEAARAQFRERWLGRYLAHDPRWAYVALDRAGEVAGYLIGCIDDPALQPRFADISLYASFKNLTAQFPAHLHVNLAPEARGAGIGSALVARFCADARQAGADGVHVITSRGSRNVGFYRRNGFVECGSTGADARAAVFLGQKL